MPIGTSTGEYYENEYDQNVAQHQNAQSDKGTITIRSLSKHDQDAAEIQENEKAGSFENRFGPADYKPLANYSLPEGPGGPLQGPTEAAGALKSTLGRYDTTLDSTQEKRFQDWKQKNAPQDSGADYDLRGAFKADVQPDSETGHWPDTFKKPNHPTFSDQSIYAKDRPDLAGHWEGDKYIPPEKSGFFSRLSMVNAFKGMLGGAKEAVENLPENFVKNVKALGETVSTPHDVMTGDLPSGSVQEIEKAADLAGLMVGAPAPIASKAADGTLGSFMGVRSNTFDRAAMEKAEKMEANNVHPDEIHEGTATFRGADAKWRQEIDDSQMQLKSEAFEHTITPVRGEPGEIAAANHTVRIKTAPKLGAPPSDSAGLEGWLGDLIGAAKQKPFMLDQVIDHPELFKAYPELRGVKVKDYPPSMGGYSPETGGSWGMMSGNSLYLARDLNPSFAKAIIMHEVQHRIQDIEGFAKGGSPSMFRPKGLDAAERYFNKVTQDEIGKMVLMGNSPEDLRSYINHINKNLDKGLSPLRNLMLPEDMAKKLVNIVKSSRLLNKAAEEHLKEYQKIMGEVESRNVEARMKYTKELREMIPPIRTEEVPREQQIDVPAEFSRSEPQSVTQFRRAANDNKNLDLGTGGFDVNKSWKDFSDRIERGNKILNEISKLNKKAGVEDWNDIDFARFKQLIAEHKKLFPPTE